MNKEDLVERLFEIGAIKFGTFTLASGIESPIYIDLRIIISYPDILKAVAQAIWQQTTNKTVDMLCGVPIAGIPLPIVISLLHNKPMILYRKDKKNHGTGDMINGVFKRGDTCLVIDDLITSGGSILKTIEGLEQAGIRVTDVSVFLDRQQGGAQRIADKGYQFNAVITMQEMLAILQEKGLLNAQRVETVTQFIKQAQF